MSALATLPGRIFRRELVRKLTYGEWNTFVSDFSQYEGTHYLGKNDIYHMCVRFLLWQIIMRKHTGTFGRKQIFGCTVGIYADSDCSRKELVVFQTVVVWQNLLWCFIHI